ncbi:MAG: hypothetical protein ACI837_002487 [Crocinitomicaceae bacterium]|jgi:hypothetical protein
MKSVHRYISLIAYLLICLTGFWFAQFISELRGGFLHPLDAILISWIIFITITVLLFRFRPLSTKRSIVRILVCALPVLICYWAYYESLASITWSENRAFLDNSLPGIMLTLGFALVWLIPASFTRSLKNDFTRKN